MRWKDTISGKDRECVYDLFDWYAEKIEKTGFEMVQLKQP